MADIIIAFPKLDDAKNLKKLLLRNGYDVSLVCDNGAQIVSAVNELDGGVVICGPCPGYTTVLSGSVRIFRLRLCRSKSKSPPCKSVRPIL